MTTELWIKLLKQSGGNVPETYENIVDAIGIEAAIKLCEDFGGSPLYVPTLKALSRKVVEEQAQKEYDGYNRKQLARKYGYSDRTIDCMVKRNQ